MTVRNLIGVIGCVAIFFFSFLIGETRAQYFNLLGLAIVVSGTLGATFLSYPFDDLRVALRVAWNSYSVKTITPKQIVDTLLDLSIRSRKGGLLSLQSAEKQTDVIFLKSALGMMVDGYCAREMRDVLQTEVEFFQRRRAGHERVFRHMARLAPAFGVAGSVVGLLAMLAGIGDTAIILQTIPLALTSTLYGILLCNFLFTPIAESIHFKTQRELLLKKLIIDGVSAISEERNPHKLEKKLASFLTPAARHDSQRSFDEIRRKYLKLRFEAADVASATEPG